MEVDLKTVSEALGVSLHQLHLIESEDHEELPDEESVKAVLRAYADFIGVDAEDIIDRYEINSSAYASASKADQKWRRLGRQNLKLVSLSVFFIAVISVLSMIGYYSWQSLSGNERERERPSLKNASAATNAEQPKPKSLVLTIDAIEKTWIKINVDGNEQLKYLLSPKDHVELEAEKSYHMLIGNAAGLRMMFNGEPVKIHGNSGQVVTLELP